MHVSESLAITTGGGFFGGILIGYALKKVIKIIAVVVGLFFAALACLQYQQILNINWIMLQTLSENCLMKVANAIEHIPNIGAGGDYDAMVFPISSFGIPLAGSISMGFVVGFIKG
jgi:uncharacterized membrane protein (Fun14 family)